VVARLVSDANARINLLRSGEVDLIDSVPIDGVKSLESQFEIVSQRSLVINQIRFNLKVFPNSEWKDVRVRQAMNMAIDRKTIVPEIYGGRADAIPGPISRSMAAFDPSLQPYAYDPDKAKSLLAAAGFANGFKISLVYPPGRRPGEEDTATAVAGYLKKVGI